MRRNECGQGEDPSLAPVVGPQHQQHVLDADDHHKRPHDDRNRTQHVDAIDRQLVRLSLERFTDRIQRTRSKIPIDDAERANHERDQTRWRALATRRRRRRFDDHVTMGHRRRARRRSIADKYR